MDKVNLFSVPVRELSSYNLFHVHCVVERKVKICKNPKMIGAYGQFSSALIKFYSDIIEAEDMNLDKSEFIIDKTLIPILKDFFVSKSLNELGFKNILAIIVEICGRKDYNLESADKVLKSVLVSSSVSKPRRQNIISFLPILYANYSILMEKFVADLFFNEDTFESSGKLRYPYNFIHKEEASRLKCFFYNIIPELFEITYLENSEAKLKVNMYFIEYFAKVGITEKAKKFINNVINYVKDNEVSEKSQEIISDLICVPTLKLKILFEAFSKIDLDKFSDAFRSEIEFKIKNRKAGVFEFFFSKAMIKYALKYANT